MSLAAESSSKEFDATGSATIFDHAPYFTLADPSHLVVEVAGVIQNFGFVQTATGIVFSIAPVAGTRIVLRRRTPQDQPLTTDGLRVFALENISRAVDRILRVIQDRTPADDHPSAFCQPVVFPQNEPLATDRVLPGRAIRQNTINGHDENGNPVLYELPGVVVPSPPNDGLDYLLAGKNGSLYWLLNAPM